MSHLQDESIELSTSNNKTQIESKIDEDDTSEDTRRSSNINTENVALKIPDRQKQKEEMVDIIYGNDINNPCPHKMGNTRTFLFYKEQPLIVIGPDCKYNFIYF